MQVLYFWYLGGGPINTIIRAAAYSILENFGDKCI